MIGAFRAQAELCDAVGFDGITVSEHHGGFAGYLPNPLQLTAWLLEWCPDVWAAPCPMLLPLRPPGLVVEEAAWLHARYPGRLGLGVAAGSLGQDFEIAGLELDGTLTERFAAGLALVAAGLAGRAWGALAEDAAVAGTGAMPVPVVSAAMSSTAARRAAALGVGLALDSISSREHLRSIVDAYMAAGGDGPRVLTRWVWVGEAVPGRVGAQLDMYRSYTPADRVARWPTTADVITGSVPEVAEGLAGAANATGATCVNLRVHIAGVEPREAMSQLEILGGEVLPLLRANWTGASTDSAFTPKPS